MAQINFKTLTEALRRFAGGETATYKCSAFRWPDKTPLSGGAWNILKRARIIQKRGGAWEISPRGQRVWTDVQITQTAWSAWLPAPALAMLARASGAEAVEC